MKTPAHPQTFCATAVFRLPLLLVALLQAVTPARAQIDRAPPNDIFANRVDLGAVESAQVTLKTLRASTELGDPIENSVWWQWTAPRDGWWFIETKSVENVPDRAGSRMQVFTGLSPQYLLVVPDGEAYAPPLSERRKFYARSGEKYQFAFQRSFSSFQLPDGPHIKFALAPLLPAPNTTPDGAAIMEKRIIGDNLLPAPVSGSEWVGSGWSGGGHAAPLSLPDGTTLYEPLCWKWTCPATGRYTFTALSPGYDAANNVSVILQGDAVTTSAGYARRPFSASVGEVFLFLNGRKSGTGNSMLFREISVTWQPAVITPNPTASFTIPSHLPVSLTPPPDAPTRDNFYWSWNSTGTGWVEFDCDGLRLGAVPGGAYLANLNTAFRKSGKFHFWSAAVSYSLVVSAWPYPEAPSFTLRWVTPPPPANDTIDEALDLGEGLSTRVSGSFFGSTRDVRDPATVEYAPQPTLWYRWHPERVSGLVEITSVELRDPRCDSELRVFQGTNPESLRPVTVTAGPASEKWSFPLDTVVSDEPYWLCLAGSVDYFEIAAKLAGPGDLDPVMNPFTRVTPLEGREVSEASAVPTPPVGGGGHAAWFRWTAPGAGWLKWISNAAIVEFGEGGTFSTRRIMASAVPEVFPVTSGQTYWFKCVTADTLDRPALCNLRLAFAEISSPPPGDDPASPLALGSQFPVQAETLLLAATVTQMEREWSRLEVGDRLSHAMWYSWIAPPGIDGCELTVKGGTCEVFEDRPGGAKVAATLAGNSYDQLHLVPQSGRTYFIMVQGIPGLDISDGTTLTLRPVSTERASNDNFANAAVMNWNGSTNKSQDSLSHYNSHATIQILSAEPGEPLAAPLSPRSVNSLWWKWTAHGSGIFRAYSLSPPYRYNGSIPESEDWVFPVAVYQGGQSLDSLERLPGVAASPHAGTGEEFSGSERSLSFRAEEGREYFLQCASPSPLQNMSLMIVPGDAYDRWSLSLSSIHPEAAGPDQNPSGDGMSNLLKFCLGLDPALPLLQDPAQDRAPTLTALPNPLGFQYIFGSNRFNTGDQTPFSPNGSPALADTVRLVAETSADLTNWTPVTNAESLGGDRWRVRILRDGQHKMRYVRLRAEWVAPSTTP